MITFKKKITKRHTPKKVSIAFKYRQVDKYV